MMKTHHTIILLAGLFAIFDIASAAAEPKVPFVASFERFGRHAEVEVALAGEVLLSELSCTACHASQHISAKGGPQLDSIARGVSEQWLRDYLASPATVKPGATMPDVLFSLTQQSKDEAITALVAFLSTLQADYPTIKAGGANPVEFEFWKKGDADRGARFYHQLGCVACHAPDAEYEVAEIAASPIDRLLEELDPDELAEMGLASTARRVESVPHGDLALKYSRHSLTHFLFQPEHFRPGGRMPNMKLAPNEAADIAAYLLQRRKPLPDVGPDGAGVVKSFESALPGTKPLSSSATGGPDDRAISPSTHTTLVENGRQLFSTLGCANCHRAGEIASQRFKPLEELDLTTASASCLVEGTGSVKYGLDAAQAAALNVAINVAMVGPTSHSQIEGGELADGDVVARTLLQMNCYACHTRDDLGGVGRYRRGYFETVTGVDLGDEGRLPPPLSGVGRKLQPTWLKRLFRGDPKTTLRPHMTIRMPTFPHADVAALADLLGKIDGANPAPASQVFANATAEIDASLTGSIGRDLMGVGCIECHAFDGQAMPGVI
ncbi:MAG: c-type cytochrome, partial [Planctomycetales bacterium]|nr:c-type cytochrome [Planctomycetales bacterium]